MAKRAGVEVRRIGNGGNIVWIDPEHDIVLVWHWHEPGKAVDGMIERIVASVTGA